MDTDRTQIYIIVSVIVLAAVMAISGYYLGRYLDVKELQSKPATNSSSTLTYKNADLGLSFVYPKTWTLKESSEVSDDSTSSNIKKVIVTSPSGSRFQYFSAVTDVTPAAYICSEADPEGDTDGNQECIFIEGGVNKFSRFRNYTSDDTVKIWNVAEKGTDSTGEYQYIPNNGFTYTVKLADDLVSMDSIMKSVTRE